MKDLEEEIKLIPVLQGQLSVLEEEKQQLLLEIRLAEAERNKHNQIKESVPAVSHRTLVGSLMLGRSQSFCEGSEHNGVLCGRRRSCRDIGVMCSLMSTELVDSKEELKMCNITTDTVSYDKKLELAKFVAEDFPPVTPHVKCICNTNMDLQMYSEKELGKALKMLESTIISKNDVRNIGIQVENKQEVALSIVEKRDSQTQTENQLANKCNQMEEPKRHLIDVGILVKPQSVSIDLQLKGKTGDIGLSDHVSLDEHCKKCNKEMKSIGVGPEEIHILEKSTLISVSNNQIFQNKPTENVAIQATKTVTTKSVACSTLTKVCLSHGTDTDDLSVGKKRDFGTNTSKSKLVDAAVGDATNESICSSNMSVCGKCDREILNDAKCMLTQNSESSATSPIIIPAVRPGRITSRIPRPVTRPAFATQSVTLAKNIQDNCRLQRQNTSTNLQISRKEKQLTTACRSKREPSKEMKSALKVLNDYLRKFSTPKVPHHLKNATKIVQQEWFKVTGFVCSHSWGTKTCRPGLCRISSIASANPLDVEDYLVYFKKMSGALLKYVVNVTDMSGNTTMHYAVSHGNYDVISILLDSKVCSINRLNAAGYTCVMLISLAQIHSDAHWQVVHRLFQVGDVNVRSKQHGQTALMLAASRGRLDVVRLLVDSGANMNIQDEDGSTALMCAAEHGDIEIVKYLISQSDCDVSIVDCDGSSAVDVAMETGNKDIGVLLYAHKHFSH